AKQMPRPAARPRKAPPHPRFPYPRLKKIIILASDRHPPPSWTEEHLGARRRETTQHLISQYLTRGDPPNLDPGPAPGIGGNKAAIRTDCPPHDIGVRAQGYQVSRVVKVEQQRGNLRWLRHQCKPAIGAQKAVH